MKYLLLLLALSSPLAQAGQESHGGSLVLCEGRELIVLDYYHATLPVFGEEQPALMPIDGQSTEAVIAAFRERLKGYPLLALLDQALKEIGPVKHWPLRNLTDVLDSNEPYLLPGSCKRVQGAVREGRRVYLDINFGRQLLPAQLGVLAVHEALFYLSGQNTSEKVRTVIRNLIVLDTSERELVASIRDLGVEGNARDHLFKQLNEHNTTFFVFSPDGGTGFRDCSLRVEAADFRTGLVSMSYEHPRTSQGYYDSNYLNGKCVDLDKFTLECLPNGKSCAVKSAKEKNGWNEGCSFELENDGFKWTARCQDSLQTRILFKY